MPIYIRLVPPAQWPGPAPYTTETQPDGVVLSWVGWNPQQPDLKILRRALIQAILVRQAIALHGQVEGLKVPLWLEDACVAWCLTRAHPAMLESWQQETVGSRPAETENPPRPGTRRRARPGRRVGGALADFPFAGGVRTGSPVAAPGGRRPRRNGLGRRVGQILRIVLQRPGQPGIVVESRLFLAAPRQRRDDEPDGAGLAELAGRAGPLDGNARRAGGPADPGRRLPGAS